PHRRPALRRPRAASQAGPARWRTGARRSNAAESRRSPGPASEPVLPYEFHVAAAAIQQRFAVRFDAAEAYHPPHEEKVRPDRQQARRERRRTVEARAGHLEA